MLSSVFILSSVRPHNSVSQKHRPAWQPVGAESRTYMGDGGGCIEQGLGRHGGGEKHTRENEIRDQQEQEHHRHDFYINRPLCSTFGTFPRRTVAGEKMSRPAGIKSSVSWRAVTRPQRSAAEKITCPFFRPNCRAKRAVKIHPIRSFRIPPTTTQLPTI